MHHTRKVYKEVVLRIVRGVKMLKIYADYSVGSNGAFEKTHDVLYHIQIKRKYIYIAREHACHVSLPIRIKKSDLHNYDIYNLTYKQAAELFFMFM